MANHEYSFYDDMQQAKELAHTFKQAQDRAKRMNKRDGGQNEQHN